MNQFIETLRDKFRAAPWLVVALAGFLWILFNAEFKVGVLIWLLTKLAAAGYLGYWLDRVLFPYARPHNETGDSRHWSYLRRALIVGCALIAAGLQA